MLFTTILYTIIVSELKCVISKNTAKFVQFQSYEYYWPTSSGQYFGISSAENECRKLKANLAIVNESAIDEFLKHELSNITGKIFIAIFLKLCWLHDVLHCSSIFLYFCKSLVNINQRLILQKKHNNTYNLYAF